jgi:cystathionine gamma-synthase/cystathionine gamma-lyase
MHGFSGMVSFELRGGRQEVDTLFAHLKLFALAESLGGVESLISYPAGMTHSSMPQEERLKRGITDNFIRVSVGIENKIDLKNDFAHALTFVP